MEIVDDDYCFRYIDVGACGIASDGSVFRNCSIYNKLLPNGGVIVADGAFPLKLYMMKPYPGDNSTLAQKVFNCRLSRAKRIVKNAFGILVSRFRIFQKPIATDVNTVDKIVLAACALHICLRKEKRNNYITHCDVDRENIEARNIIHGTWRTETTGLENLCRQGTWSVVKRQVKSNNKTFKLPDVKNILAECVAKVDAKMWKNFISHTIKEENKFWTLDDTVDELTAEQESVIMTIGNSDTEDDDFDLLSDRKIK
ncbi:hypothetical protein QTP88_010715 [Uroleucon formosanum]